MWCLFPPSLFMRHVEGIREMEYCSKPRSRLRCLLYTLPCLLACLSPAHVQLLSRHVIEIKPLITLHTSYAVAVAAVVVFCLSDQTRHMESRYLSYPVLSPRTYTPTFLFFLLCFILWRRGTATETCKTFCFSVILFWERPGSTHGCGWTRWD